MSIRIEYYIHYYIGQDCMVGEYKGKILSVGSYEMGEKCIVSGTNQDEDSGFFGEYEENDADHSDIKPILRPMSDMTKEEKDYGNGVTLGHTTNPERQRMAEASRTHWLLKQGFDLFGLIEAGLAVDKNK